MALFTFNNNFRRGLISHTPQGQMQYVIFGGHLENGGHFENFQWLMIDFGKVSHKDAFCQISCLYPDLNYYLSYLLHYG